EVDVAPAGALQPPHTRYYLDRHGSPLVSASCWAPAGRLLGSAGRFALVQAFVPGVPAIHRHVAALAAEDLLPEVARLLGEGVFRPRVHHEPGVLADLHVQLGRAPAGVAVEDAQVLQGP